MSIPPRTTITREYDVLIVGAGVVGLGHAVAAADAGESVLVVDRDHRPVGASVRNFGHVCATGQEGELRDLALRSRDRWLDVASRADIPVRRDAGLAVARRADELAVLEELGDRRASVVPVTADETRTALGGAGAPDLLGGARLLDDLRVDPRTAVRSLAAWLECRDDVDIAWNTSYLGVDEADGDTGVVVRTSRGPVRAQRVYVCVGHDLDYTTPDAAESAGVARCALTMMLAADPGVRIEPAVLTATSLLRYGAFAATDAVGVLRERLTAERPDLIAADTNIMFTQRPDGTLLIGDSHHSAPTVEPFVEERVADLIRGEVESVLGVELTVIQRWQGVYATRPGGPFLTAEVAPGVRVCSVTTGVGMTIGLELAARHVAGELD